MIRHSVFATNIFVEDDFIDKSISSDMKQYIEQLWTIREYDNNWQTDLTYTLNLHLKSLQKRSFKKVKNK